MGNFCKILSMKANELRIGNLLNYNGEIREISTIHQDNTIRFKDEKEISIGCFSLRSKSIEPIPLTEEWLLKFGFIHSKLFDCDLFTSSWNFHISVLSGEYQLNYKESAKSQWIPLIKIKHVHTLQNLYFALTGEELNTITL